MKKQTESTAKASNAITFKKPNKNTWWEASAYAIRGISVVVPTSIVLCLQDSWLKSGMGFTAMLMTIAVILIYREPLKKAMNLAPGVVPFLCFVILAIFFRTAGDSLLMIGISGLSGCTVSVPLHLKYLNGKNTVNDKTLQELRELANKLTNS